MKKNAMVIVVCLALALPAGAQTWNKWDTRSTISGVFSLASSAIASAERKKEMEILSRQKAQYEQSFKDAMQEAKDAEADGPSFLNNDKTILPSYDAYRYVRDNPVYVNKKQTNTKIVRVACSETETRLELEYEALLRNNVQFVKGTAYIKGNKGGKLGLSGVENITMYPAETCVPWPYMRLRFVLIFPPLPAEATEFDFIVPSSTWQFKDIKCK